MRYFLLLALCFARLTYAEHADYGRTAPAAGNAEGARKRTEAHDRVQLINAKLYVTARMTQVERELQAINNSVITRQLGQARMLIHELRKNKEKLLNETQKDLLRQLDMGIAETTK